MSRNDVVPGRFPRAETMAVRHSWHFGAGFLIPLPRPFAMMGQKEPATFSHSAAREDLDELGFCPSAGDHAAQAAPEDFLHAFMRLPALSLGEDGFHCSVAVGTAGARSVRHKLGQRPVSQESSVPHHPIVIGQHRTRLTPIPRVNPRPLQRSLVEVWDSCEGDRARQGKLVSRHRSTPGRSLATQTLPLREEPWISTARPAVASGPKTVA